MKTSTKTITVVTIVLVSFPIGFILVLLNETYFNPHVTISAELFRLTNLLAEIVGLGVIAFLCAWLIPKAI